MAKATHGQIFYGNAIANSYDMVRNTLAVDVEGNSFKNLKASSTNYVSTGAGVLVGIVLGTNGGTVDIYDNTIASGTTMGQIAADAPEQFFPYWCAYSTGLTIVVGATTNATAVFRPFVSAAHSGSLSPSASTSPSKSPSASPSVSPSASPSTSPSKSPSASPSVSPSASPSG